MENIIYNWSSIVIFLLVFMRMSAFFVAAPAFSSHNIPALVKIGLAFFTSIIIFPFVSSFYKLNLSRFDLFIFYVAKEVAIGLVIGFSANFAIQTLLFAGELIDLQIGFAMANLFDPATQTRTSLIGEFYFLFSTLTVFELNVHHDLLRLIYESFKLISTAGFTFTTKLMETALMLYVGMFALGVKIAFPVISILVITDLIMGILARTMPQLNIFSIGFPIKGALGLLVLVLAMPFFSEMFAVIFDQMNRDVLLIMRSMS